MDSNVFQIFSVRTIEALLRTHDARFHAYIDVGEEVSGGGPVQRVHVFVVVSDVFEGVGRYCRVPVGAFELVAGRPLDDKFADEVSLRAHQAKEVVAELARAFSVRTIEGQLGLPRDLRTTYGNSERLSWNPVTGRYDLREPSHEVD